MKVQADNVNGVYKVDDFEGEVMSQEDFYEALSTNPEDSVICADIDDAMAARIEEEYGIHSLYEGRLSGSFIEEKMELKTPEEHIRESLEKIIGLMVTREEAHGKPDSAFVQNDSLSVIFGTEKKSADELRKAEMDALTGYIKSELTSIECHLEEIAQTRVHGVFEG